MSIRPLFAAVTTALVCATLAKGQLAVGDVLPPQALEEFSQTGATSYTDLAGRAVLFEFFAYW
jgi:hypothetical protein